MEDFEKQELIERCNVLLNRDGVTPPWPPSPDSKTLKADGFIIYRSDGIRLALKVTIPNDRFRRPRQAMVFLLRDGFAWPAWGYEALAEGILDRLRKMMVLEDLADV